MTITEICDELEKVGFELDVITGTYYWVIKGDTFSDSLSARITESYVLMSRGVIDPYELRFHSMRGAGVSFEAHHFISGGSNSSPTHIVMLDKDRFYELLFSVSDEIGKVIRDKKLSDILGDD